MLDVTSLAHRGVHHALQPGRLGRQDARILPHHDALQVAQLGRNEPVPAFHVVADHLLARRRELDSVVVELAKDLDCDIRRGRNAAGVLRHELELVRLSSDRVASSW